MTRLLPNSLAQVVMAIALGCLATPAGAATPDDPRYVEQNNLHAEGIDAVGAWRRTYGHGATVALIDCGVEFTHPDLMHIYWLNPRELPVTADADLDGDITWDELAAAATSHPEWELLDRDGNGLDLGDVFASRLMNGVDDDDNGFVDDISGWDFDDDDPIPEDITECGHGNGRAGILAAEWNAIGTAGILRDGRIVSLRTSDSILHSVDALAQAIAYAGSLRVASVNMSLGALGRSPLLSQAATYANQAGVFLAAASGNEYVPDVEIPAGLEGVVAVGSVSPDPWNGLPWEVKVGSTSFGPHLVLAAPSNVWTTAFPAANGWWREGGTSSATPHAAGTAALLQSRAKVLDYGQRPGGPLDSLEVRQLLQATAKDITGTKYGAEAGWDRFTGYGRIQAGAAVAALDDVALPPIAELREPAMFAYIDPALSPTVDIVGRVDAPRATRFGYTIELAAGVDVTTFTTVYENHGLTAKLDGTLASGIDLAALAVTGVSVSLAERFRPSSYAVTVRLTVMDESHINAQGRPSYIGTDRQTFYMRREPDLRAGFPLQFFGSLEAAPLLIDLDGDGGQEIVVCDTGGRVFVIDAHGKIVWTRDTAPLLLRDKNFSQWLAGRGASADGSPILSGAAGGDLDGDGSPEVVVATWDGRLHAWHANGDVVTGFPTDAALHPLPEGGHSPARFLAAPVLTDLDGDGRLEIIIGADDRKIYAFRSDGARQPGWPVLLVAEPETSVTPIAATVTAVDLDQDGRPEIVVGTSEARLVASRIYAIRPDGTTLGPRPFLPGWPVFTFGAPAGFPLIGLGIAASAGAADFDGDGRPEIVGGGFAGYGSIFSDVGVEHTTFDRVPGDFGAGADNTESYVAAWLNGAPAFGDLDGDGLPEVVAPLIGLGSIATALLQEDRPDAPIPDLAFYIGAWRADGRFLPGWPRRIDPFPFLQNPAIADIDGDGQPEVLAGGATGWLHAYRVDAAGDLSRPDDDNGEISGWPKFTGAWILGSPAVGDLDGDGTVEVVATDREGRLFVWQGRGSINDIHWSQFHADSERSGVYQARKKAEVPVLHSGCNSGSSNGATMTLLLAVVIAAWVNGRINRGGWQQTKKGARL